MAKELITVGIIGAVISVIAIGACIAIFAQPNSSVDESDIKTTPPTGESLQTILAKSEEIESLYYEIDMSMKMSQYGTQTATMKIWQEKPYLKEQITSVTAGITNTILVIQRPEGTYVYNTAQGKYVLTNDVPSYVTSLQYLDSKMIKDLLNNQSITDFKTDIIDGKQATIVEYSLPIQGENQMTIKVWIWNAKGLPLKAFIDMTMGEMTMTMNFIFSNYSFSDIPDSTFSVS